MPHNSQTSVQLTPLPFRLTIGVTGHRRLEKAPLIQETVKRALKMLKEEFALSPDKPLQLEVISPLAEGADRLVVQACYGVDPDCRLKAVLPLAHEDYLRDFESQASREEFKELLHRSQRPLYLRKGPIHEEIPEDQYPDQDDFRKKVRRQAYEAVGRFVVDHCDVLIAIWDGKPPRSKGGTGQIVKYAHQTQCPMVIINTNTPDEFTLREGKSASETVYAKIDRFNAHLENAATYQAYVDNQYRDLFGKNPGADLPRSLKDRVRDYLIPYYAVASKPAKAHQGTYRNAGLLIFWLAFSAVCLVGTGVIFWHASPYVFLVESILLGIISFVILYADRIRGAHQNWREFRFLAERIRSAFFCSLGNARPKPLFFKRRREGENSNVAWMMMAVEEIYYRLPETPPLNMEAARRITDYIGKAWIEDQKNYFEKKQSHDHKNLESIEWTGKVLFYFALGAALLHFIIPLVYPAFHHGWISHAMTLMALILPALAATIEAILYHREYKRLVHHSERMQRILNDIRRDFDLLTPEKLTQKLIEMDTVMLEEGREWFDLLRPAELHPVL